MSSSLTLSSSSEPGAPPVPEPPVHPLAGLLDVVCVVDFIIGAGSVTMRQCLQLERGSVLRLAQAAGSDLEIRANGIPVASGEVVIVDDSTAIRISRVLPPPGMEP